MCELKSSLNDLHSTLSAFLLIRHLTADMNLQNFTVLYTLLYLLYQLLHPTVLPLLPSCEASRAKRLTNAIRNEETVEMSKYVVSIRSIRPHRVFGDNHFCNGAIVAPKFVLTVATCTMRWVSLYGHNHYNYLLPLPPYSLSVNSDKKVMHLKRSVVVVAGTFNRLIQGSRSLTLPVKKFHVPSKYTKSGKYNIALLEVVISWPTLNPAIKIVNLPTDGPNENTEFMVLGWGRLYRVSRHLTILFLYPCRGYTYFGHEETSPTT